MALNCKQGDLALVIAGPSAGITVTCLQALPAGWWRDDLPARARQRGARQQIEPAVGPLWRVDRTIQWETPVENRRHGISTEMYVVPDNALMPIRPEPDELEMPRRERIAKPAEC